MRRKQIAKFSHRGVDVWLPLQEAKFKSGPEAIRQRPLTIDSFASQARSSRSRRTVGKFEQAATDCDRNVYRLGTITEPDDAVEAISVIKKTQRERKLAE